MQRIVTTTYLEMTSREDLRPAARNVVDYTVTRAEIPCPELNRFLYTAVGAPWCWYSRLSWSRVRWLQYLSGPVETWVAYVSGTPAGYFELELQEGGAVELAFFGLLPMFVGRGLGGPLLSDALHRSWELASNRVWVHTCDLDHPHAIANYEARGFTVIKVEAKLEELPEGPLESWPGAGDV